MNRLSKSVLRYVDIALFMLFITSCSTKTQTSKRDSLKVLSWNIWHGGHSKYLPSYGCEGTLGIMEQSGADVILVIETYGAAAKIADHLGFYHRSLSDNLSIYSRYPITKTYTYEDQISTSNFGGVEIDMNGQKVRIFDTWLHYLPGCRSVPTDKSEEEIIAWDKGGSRDSEITTILTILEPFISQADSIPLIIGGDFNIHSHLDWTEQTKDLYSHGGAVVNWTVSTKMQQSGFIDSFREINPDPVKEIGTTWMHPLEEDWEVKRASMEQTGSYMPYPEGQIMRYDRIDFIYYQGAKIQATDSKIYNRDIGQTISLGGKEYFWASDHGLVLTTFDIE